MFVHYFTRSTVNSFWTLTYLLLYTYSINVESIKVHVFKGWYTYIISGSDNVHTVLTCAALFAERMQSSTAYPLATYNKATSECKIATNMPPHIVLHYSGDDMEMVLWDENGCSLTNGVFKKLADTDLYGYDFGSENAVIPEECITSCATSFPNNHGFVFRTREAGNICYCKTISKQEYIYGGNTLTPRVGYDYYERLC